MRRRTGTTPGEQGRFAGYDVLAQLSTWDEVTAGVVLRRWLISSGRQVWGPVMSLVQPVIWILLFGSVFSSLGALPQFGGAGYIDYLVPGILMMTVLYSGAWAGTGFIDDISSGVMDRMLTSPVSRSSLVAGQ